MKTTLRNKSVRVERDPTGNKTISIHGLEPRDLEEIAALLDLEIRDHFGVRWIELPKARDKSKVRFFEGGEI